MKFNKQYFLLAIILFCIEVLIAKFAHDSIIRPYVGDILVVILLYCFVKSFIDSSYIPTAFAVLLFSYVIETLQYFHIVNRLGFGHSNIARIIIGTSFEWVDMVAYTVGAATVVYIEMEISKRKLGAHSDVG